MYFIANTSTEWDLESVHFAEIIFNPCQVSSQSNSFFQHCVSKKCKKRMKPSVSFYFPDTKRYHDCLRLMALSI